MTDLFVINTFNMQNLCDSLALLLYCKIYVRSSMSYLLYVYMLTFIK